MDYKEALVVLEEWDNADIDRTLPPALAEMNKEAFEKAKQALRDCLEMGLNGDDD